MKDVVVQLLRRFHPVTSHFNEFFSVSSGKALRWHEIENAYRVLILADPGAGKTFEALDRARKIRDRGVASFFIRIESIDAQFSSAFEVGTSEEFDAWLASSDEAWFFLDSVDEALLDTPRALEDAVKIFATRIKDARERAHIFITSRDDAWQALPDQTLIEQYLPHGGGEDEDPEKSTDSAKEPTLKIFRLAGLKLDEIKLFASYYGIGDANEFVTEVQRGNLMSLAERPFDLRGLIKKWQADRSFGSRLEVLSRMIELELAPLAALGNPTKIAPEKARAGARALAIAVLLTGRTVIRLPSGANTSDRICPMEVLPDWSSEEIDALLHRGVFDDVVYGSVRFRHREIRELLAAEWANDLLSRPDGKAKVENLFFRMSYGEEIVVPRTRPLLPWLVLLNDGIRDRALALEPEIATEGGDPSKLPLPVRQTMLAEIVARIIAGSDA